MKIAISNIAWDASEDVAIAKLLNKYNITTIDIAPGKYFSNFNELEKKDIKKIKNWWHNYGININSMQSLLFGTSGLNIFGPVEIQKSMLKHLSFVCNIGAELGATPLVFGSPTNRDKSGLNNFQAMNIAVPFFQKLGNIAESFGVVVCLEPNPTIYNSNFMTTVEETVSVVEYTSHKAIKMQLDTGAININSENINDVLRNYSALIGHIHISEPNLIPIGDGNTNHNKIYKSLQKYLPDHVLSIEMITTKNEPHIKAVETSY